MSPITDFDQLDLYRTVRELTSFVYDLEDRFPEDELDLLFRRLRAAAVDLGAALAAGFGRDGIDASGDLSEATMREVRARLSELRHYVLAAEARYFLDENHVRSFQVYYDRIRGALKPSEGEA